MVDVYKIQSKRELIQFEIDGKEMEKTLKPLKNKQLIEMQELSEKTNKLKNLEGKINPKTKQVYTEEEIEEVGKEYEKRIKEIIFKDSFTPPFTNEELDEAETPILLEIMERAVALNGLEKAMAFQERVKAGQTSPSKMSPKDSLASLNANPRQKLT